MKMFIGKAFLTTLFLTGISLNATEPYDSIENLPQTPYYVQDGYVYFDLIKTHSAAVIIDVDSQDGGVARFIAGQAPNLPSLKKI